MTYNSNHISYIFPIGNFEWKRFVGKRNASSINQFFLLCKYLISGLECFQIWKSPKIWQKALKSPTGKFKENRSFKEMNDTLFIA